MFNLVCIVWLENEKFSKLLCYNSKKILPVSIAPFGILAPRSKYCCGFFKKFTNSMISILASSQPATSLKRNDQINKLRT